MPATAYLRRHPRTGIYWFRRAVPVALRAAIGRCEIVRSLKTRDRREARRLALVHAVEAENILAQAQGRATLLPTSSLPPAAQDLAALVEAAVRKALHVTPSNPEPPLNGLRLNEAFERYDAERRLRPQARIEFLAAIRRFREVVGEDRPVAAITKADIRAFKEVLMAMSEQSEVMEAGRKILDLLRRDPPGRPIHDPVLRHVKGKVNPAAVLDPAYRVVKFMNRDQEMADWLDWARNRNLPGRLLTGAGGMGKTRLLIEICEKLRHEGWRTGFLKEGAIYGDLCRQLVGREKWLIVVDYAERRPDDVDILCRAIRATVRLALLARREGEWLEDMVAGTGAAADFLDNGEGLDRLELGPAAPARSAGRLYTRQAVFEHAIKDYESAESLKARSAYRTIDFDDSRYDNILQLLLEAWARVPGAREYADAGSPPLEAVLKRETRYLKRCLPTEISSRSLMKVLCWIYKKGPAETYEGAIALLAQCPALSGQSADMVSRVAEVFHDVYPGPHWLNRIQPDLIGEEVVRRYGPWNP